MLYTSHYVRLKNFAVMLALAFALVSGLTLTQPTFAQDDIIDSADEVPIIEVEAEAEIGVVAQLCPEGYTGTNFAADCVTPIADVFVYLTLEGTQDTLSSQTDATGVFRFTHLLAGTHLLELGIPGDFASFSVECYGPGGTPYGTGTENRINLTVGTYDAVTCYWFVTPESQNGPEPTPTPSPSIEPAAEIGVVVWLCPDDYTGPDFAEYCREPLEGVRVFLTLDGTQDTLNSLTDATGVFRFTHLPAGTHRLELGIPGDFAKFFVGCYGPGGGEFGSGFTNIIDITVGNYDAATCYWFVTVEDQRGPSPSPTAKPTVAPTAVPTAAPSAQPTVAPTASPSGQPVVTLPDTGAGSGSVQSASVMELGLISILTIIALGAGAVFMRRSRVIA